MKRMIVACVVVLSLAMSVGAQSLDQQFVNPPVESRPWCYWYWINNHISKDGVTKDLEAMAEVGIGTALIGNQYFGNERRGPVKNAQPTVVGHHGSCRPGRETIGH